MAGAELVFLVPCGDHARKRSRGARIAAERAMKPSSRVDASSIGL
jgi:hypothetical protein